MLHEKAIGAQRCDEEMVAVLQARGVDLVALAGFLRKVRPRTLERFSGRVINTHPAPLPRFGGKGMFGEQVHRAVLGSGRDSLRRDGALGRSGVRHWAESSPSGRFPSSLTTTSSLRDRVQRAEREPLLETVAKFARESVLEGREGPPH